MRDTAQHIASAPSGPRAGGSLKLWLFRVHALAGVIVSMAIMFMFLTGSLAIFSPEIDRLVYPQRAIDGVPAEDAVVSLGASYEAVRTGYPEAAIVSILRALGEGLADEVTVRAPWGETLSVWVDPRTGAIAGTSPLMDVNHVLHELHRNLFLHYRVGIVLTTLLGFVIAVSIVTGLMSYRRFWRGLFRFPRRQAAPAQWWGALHRVLALWLVPFLAIVSATTMIYFIEVLGFEGGFPRPERAAPRVAAIPADLDGARMDTIVALARAEYPGLRVVKVGMPENPRRGVTVEFEGTATLVRPRATTVTVDPVTLRVLGRFRGEDLGPHRRVDEALDPLHYGYWGGMPSRIAWLVFGLMGAALAGAGMVLFQRRLGRSASGISTRTGTRLAFAVVAAMVLAAVGGLGARLYAESVRWGDADRTAGPLAALAIGAPERPGAAPVPSTAMHAAACMHHRVLVARHARTSTVAGLPEITSKYRIYILSRGRP